MILDSIGRSSSQKQGKTKQCYADSSVDLEIIVDHVKGMEILLASSHPLYASRALHWHGVLRLRSFFVFGCGKASRISILFDIPFSRDK